MKKTQTIKLALLGAAFLATHAMGQNAQQIPQDSMAGHQYQRQMPVENNRTKVAKTKTASVKLPKVGIAKSSINSISRGGFGGGSRRVSS